MNQMQARMATAVADGMADRIAGFGMELP